MAAPPRPTAWADRFLRSARGRLITRLRHGPATVQELAEATGLTANGVRVHLATLERDGWIHGTGVRRSEGPGKPATLYALSPEAAPLLSNAYRPLLLALLEVLHAEVDPARRASLLRNAGRALANLVPKGPGTASERAVRLLEELGGAVQVEPGPGSRFVLQSAGCPVGEAVTLEPRVCEAVKALLGAALDAKVVERCDRSGGEPRCRFEVSPGRRA